MGLTLMGLRLGRSVDDAIDRAEFRFGDVLQLDFTVLNDSVQCFYSGILNISLGSVIVGAQIVILRLRSNVTLIICKIAMLHIVYQIRCNTGVLSSFNPCGDAYRYMGHIDVKADRLANEMKSLFGRSAISRRTAVLNLSDALDDLEND